MCFHQCGRHKLSLREDLFLGVLAAEFAATEGAQNCHGTPYSHRCTISAVGRIEQLGYDSRIFGFKSVYGFLRTGNISFVQIFTDFDKSVCGAGHSRQHHDITSGCSGKLSDMFYSFGRSDRSTSEFQYLHSLYLCNLSTLLFQTAKIRISRVQSQIYLSFAEWKYLRRNQRYE